MGVLAKQTEVPMDLIAPLENQQQMRPPASNGARPEDTNWGETLLEDQRAAPDK